VPDMVILGLVQGLTEFFAGQRHGPPHLRRGLSRNPPSRILSEAVLDLGTSVVRRGRA